jgi:predicted NBD/HSP70 family sugar kinase
MLRIHVSNESQDASFVHEAGPLDFGLIRRPETVGIGMPGLIDVDRGTLSRDFHAFLRQLADRGLVRLPDDPNG